MVLDKLKKYNSNGTIMDIDKIMHIYMWKCNNLIFCKPLYKKNLSEIH